MSFSVSLNPCIASSGRSRKSLRLDATVRLCRKRFRRKARALISRSNTYFMRGVWEKWGLSLFFESFEERHRHRGGHGQVVALVDLARARSKRAAHDEPHDHLGALVAAELHELRQRHACEALGVAIDQLEELEVPFLVVEPGALADHLVRKPASAHDRDL